MCYQGEVRYIRYYSWAALVDMMSDIFLDDANVYIALEQRKSKDETRWSCINLEERDG